MPNQEFYNFRISSPLESIFRTPNHNRAIVSLVLMECRLPILFKIRWNIYKSLDKHNAIIFLHIMSKDKEDGERYMPSVSSALQSKSNERLRMVIP